MQYSYHPSCTSWVDPGTYKYLIPTQHKDVVCCMSSAESTGYYMHVQYNYFLLSLQHEDTNLGHTVVLVLPVVALR